MKNSSESLDPLLSSEDLDITHSNSFESPYGNPNLIPDDIPSLKALYTSNSLLQKQFLDSEYGPSPPLDSLTQRPTSFHHKLQGVTCLSDLEFINIIRSVQEAIDHGIFPEMISKGSSGSYFCKNLKGEIVGVFKPKDEEPYGHLNPKCTKWIHRNLFPCCFGRGCLIPNLGYISEAAASFIDARLGLGIVPRTEIIYLASPTFFYPLKDRWAYRWRNKPLPAKIGSFQIFLKGFTDASQFFYQGYERLRSIASQEGFTSETESMKSTKSLSEWSEETKLTFKLKFERMVVLDYLVRQTDRGMDNWMVKLNQEQLNEPLISIAAIDNGLAFPYKHPDRFRSYPFGWVYLPLAKLPMSQETSHQVLCYLTSQSWWEETIDGLHALFKIDQDFSEQMFQKQIGVMRGQNFNLIEMLRRCASPVELVARPLVTIIEENDNGLVQRSKKSLETVKKTFQQLVTSRPLFSSC